jgi:hypothetical protein
MGIERIVDTLRQLGLKLEKGNMDMAPDAVYNQIIHSASLLKAVWRCAKE